MNEINVKSRFRTRCLVFVGKHVCNICMFRVALSDSFVRSPLIDISVEHKDQLLMPCYVNRSTNQSSPDHTRPKTLPHTYRKKLTKSPVAVHCHLENVKIKSGRSIPKKKKNNHCIKPHHHNSR